MMIINDFCAPIALAATLSMAFVAAESVKSYTSFLCERFFKFQDFVKSSFDECRSLLTDSETLNHLDVAEIGDGKTTVSEIEALKRERESLQKEIDKTAEEKQKRLPAVCEAESMSSICLFVFLINTVYLTREDLDKIMAVDLSKYPAGYEQARDIFMIGVWTAQRVSDYNNIKKEDFSTLTKNIMREEEDPNEPGNKIAWIEKQEIT